MPPDQPLLPLRRHLLPGELTTAGTRTRARRTVRDWCVDVLLFGCSLLLLLAVLGAEDELRPDWLRELDTPLGVAACLSLWLRRRHPLGVAIAALPAAALSDTAIGALIVIVFNIALRLPWRLALLMLALHIAVAVPLLVLYVVPDDDGRAVTITFLALYLGFFAWGSAARARRQLVVRLREDAVRARADHERRLTDVRRAERRAIAREMHDVLAHRVSLLSVHAGALAYRTRQSVAGRGAALDEEEIAQSATVIRDNAHQALEELREVLHVLREDEGEESPEGGEGPSASAVPGGIARPQPDLERIGELVAEARAAGQEIVLDDALPPDPEPPLRPQLQRSVYRVVQEGLTNARKHAAGRPVRIRLGGGPGDGVTVRVTTPLPGRAAASAIPGAGAGLTGLSERLEIEGGRLRYGPQEGVFTLLAWLPWPV
ncbi:MULTISPECIES: sensor histidine kinase [Streptomyces]|uniref:histidine kinase n=1 Tax=Streptomyces cacaoi TaxID=1898 RepID=A0A4Y3R7J2_STRCI|nr:MULTISPECIES: sensor histidine kinase [Streptomyces]NNG87250.1 histidine kinase [Streptomyces cacaoi]QHF92793.1 histidine kinase [Streptomyces sp. NHF165]GEB52717.1 two-component sensor histidine kinase [Streptomyces cacaoi]